MFKVTAGSNRPIQAPCAKRRRVAAVGCCAALLGLAAWPIQAQTYPFALDKPGKWNPAPPVKPQIAPGATPEDQAAAAAWSNQLFDILHRMPLLASPVGIEVAPAASAGLDNVDHLAGLNRPLVLVGTAVVSLNPYEKMPQGVLANSQDAAASIRIAVNDLSALNPGGLDDFFRDDQGRFYSTSKESTGTSHGFPLYGETLLMTRNKVPVFIPVSRGRYVKAKIAQMEKRVADAQARRSKLAGNSAAASVMPQLNEAIAGQQRYVDALKAQYAAMSGAERDGPAVVSSDGGATNLPEFAAPDDADGTHILYINPALVDKNLPRTAVQILTVTITSDEEQWPGLGAKLNGQLDWSALAGMLR
jgi:hypothetical protein